MENHFHIKGWAVNLALIQRPGGTRKWLINFLGPSEENSCGIVRWFNASSITGFTRGLHISHLFFFQHLMVCTLFLRATRGAGNPNLQVVITHASHVCTQHSFGLPLRMNGMPKTQLRPCTPRNLITRVLTICYVKLTQSTVLEQKRLDLRSLSPALPNLWLLLVITHASRVCLTSI